ncbi:signal recognition particle subunit SRP68-like [Ctenocephalides felis]|uniref:signal recognition particle subunit SRP68-like n=1 Tax=Ctenocephalides felis TaxID=7515 RepID=UPI000E6E3CFA|nr:signal recognition particle subunit SRP68-like [Ctenocephalides felis]
MVAADTESAEDKSLEVEEVSKPEEVSPKVFSLEILRVIYDAQQQHGLRHGDYQRYRGYCSRRLRRLRKVLKIPQGDRRHFKKRDVTESHFLAPKADERLLHISLNQAERSWSYAMQLRQEANTEPRKKYHLISRLRKACMHAQQLHELCKLEYCDARTKLEAEAYVAWIQGSLYFELSMWKEAAENLKKAQIVYEGILKALNDEDKAFYQNKIDEITPSLRYCAYNIGDGTAIEDLIQLRGKGLLNNIDQLVAQTRERNVESLQYVEWRGNKIPVRLERVKLFLLGIEDLDKSISNSNDVTSKISLIENTLMDLKDTISSVRDELKNDKTKSSSQMLLTYLLYIRLTRTIERNLLLVEQAQQVNETKEQSNKAVNKKKALGKPTEGKTEPKKVNIQNIARLYEIIIQNVLELQQLPGMETDDSFLSEMDILLKSFKAFRCYYIAEILLNMKRHRDCVAMYEKSLSYCKESLIHNLNSYNLPQQLRKLQKTIEGSKCLAHAHSVLDEEGPDDMGTSKKSAKSKVPLFDRLSEYKEDSQLLTTKPNVYALPPKMEAMPCKPLFFDLALNLIEFPDLNDKIGESRKQGDNQGITGFVKGLWSWSGNKK